MIGNQYWLKNVIKGGGGIFSSLGLRSSYLAPSLASFSPLVLHTCCSRHVC